MPQKEKQPVISEIFGPVLQGEGALIGRPTLFVRTGGCDFRCAWCDTLYAVLPEHRSEWTPMSETAILARLDELSRDVPMLVTLSGGNPALQPLDKLITLGRQRGYSFALETQGSVSRDWFAQLDYLVLSPKPPSSHMPMDDQKLKHCIKAARRGHAQISLKVVVFDDADYEFARAIHHKHQDIPFYLQVGNPMTNNTEEMTSHDNVARLTERLKLLGERVLADNWNSITVLPQMHVLIYGNRRGV